MSLRGIVRGSTIVLETAPNLPDGTAVEVELRKINDPLWGVWADKPELAESVRQIVNERAQTKWRTRDAADNS